MKPLIVVSSFIVLFFLGFTVARPHKKDPGDIITVDELRQHVSYLASDQLRGRFFSSEGYQSAAKYAAAKFEKAGLKTIMAGDINGAYFQQVPFEKVEFESNLTLTIGEQAYAFTPGDHFLISFAPYIEKEIQGEAAFIGFSLIQPKYGWDDYKDIDIKNKWVFLMSDLPDSVVYKNFAGAVPDSMRKIGVRINNAFKSGAIGVIGIKNPKELPWDKLKRFDKHFKERYVLDSNSLSYYPNMTYFFIDSTLTNLFFKNQSYNPLNGKGKYGSFDLKDVRIKLSRKHINTTQIKSNNVIAVVPGTDAVLKNEYITVGAHLDHLGVLSDSIYNGADDNASGSAAVLEIADAVANSKPKRSVIFILYTAEEEGLLGSRYFINNAPVPVKNIKFNLNLDMIGRPDGEATDLFTVSAGKISQKYKKLLQDINDKTEKLLLDTTDKKNFSQRSDQASFLSKGIPNLFFSTGEHIDYHTPGDDPEKIDYKFLQRVTRLSYDLVMELANEQSHD